MPPNQTLPEFTTNDSNSGELLLINNNSVMNSTKAATTANVASGCVAVTTHNQLRPLHCAAQQYAWGRLGSSSSVALMKDAQSAQEEEQGDDMPFSIDEDKPYAELWLGTHPNGMSTVTVENDSNNSNNKHSLLEYIRTDPGLHCGDAQATDISFLLKVLSVRKVLSIQAHPDKALAEKLHAERPTIYKDPNHKPEMAIALSEQGVRAMCGFRPLHEIAQHLEEYPEFVHVIGTDVVTEIQRNAQKKENVNDHDESSSSTATTATLRRMFQAYLEAPAHVLSRHIGDMVDRLQQMDKPQHNSLQKLILQLEQQFPGDCGIFAPLIFNVVELEFGQGLFIGANEPHAYISGEILECMACSDNVVRAGLTPKLKDAPTLLHMLTYKTCMPDIHAGTAVDECTTRYQPPVQDFCVEIVNVAPGATYEMKHVASPSVMLTMEGDATLQQENVCRLDISYGSAAFCSANTTCTIVAGPYGVRLTRAFTNVYHQDN